MFRIISNLFKKDDTINEIETLKLNVFKLAISEAEKVLEKILGNTSTENFSIELEKNSFASSFVLHDSIKFFFETYRSVSQTFGEIKLDSKSVSYSNYRKAYIKIAEGSDFTELVVMGDSAEIHEIDGSDQDFTDEPFPSIYHWLIFSCLVLHPELHTFEKQK